jgi:hypothetical protein
MEKNLPTKFTRKVFLKLASWIHLHQKELDFEDLSSKSELLKKYDHHAHNIPTQNKWEVVIGQFLQEATTIDSSSPEGWRKYGNWCWRTGHKILSNIKNWINNKEKAIDDHHFLTKEEMEMFASILKGTNLKQKDGTFIEVSALF